ncbi:hypothetical protein HOP50_04g31640 [Chloropicon primus]|nr:hypothetical protein A3770_04p31600 [Chloropicon primus]UPQ99854.1 hypothetical protein HOP50_04g31640 [Chloropicon primus]|eukprot:QDZ20642.1 hypothetical protein A3770_04p31600 [Chloropicon primus]
MLCVAAALVAVLSSSGAHAQMSTADVMEKAPVFGVPALTPEECGATIENSTTDMIIAFSSCLATDSASEACCGAVQDTFAFENEKFGGCLCHPVLMNTVMELAEGFLPGSKELIPRVMNDCVDPDGNYSSSFPFYGQASGSEQCDPSVLVNTDAVDLSVLGELAPTVGAQSKDTEEEAPAAGGSDAPDQADRRMDTALTVFSVVAAEDCGANLQSGKGELIGALTPCIIAEAPTQECCNAVEQVFRPDNERFGGCLCHKEVMDGIFDEAEGFLPGSTALIENAFEVCTNDFGSQFSFHGQKVGHVACSSEDKLQAPSLNQAGSSGSEQEEEGPTLLGDLQNMFGSSSSAASPGAVASYALVAASTLAYAFLL